MSSLANSDIYPENRAESFTNKLQKPIILNNNLDYEVALAEVFVPKEVYGLKKMEVESSLEIHVTTTEEIITVSGDVGRQLTTKLAYTYTPEKNIIATNTMFLISSMNNDILYDISLKKGDFDLKEYIHASGPFFYDASSNRVCLNLVKGPICSDERPICFVSVKMGRRMAALLGFEAKKEYQIFYSHKDFENFSHIGHTFGDHPPNSNSGIEYIIINSDIVERSPFGGQSVNVLDIISHDSIKTHSYHTMLFYKLNTKILSSISIKIVDQNGIDVPFKDFTSSICVLRIRAKPPV